MTDKVDFKKTLDAYQATRGVFRILEVPELQYLMIDGHGDPNTSVDYVEAVRALYPVACKLKFASLRDLGRDYVVMPMCLHRALVVTGHGRNVPCGALSAPKWPDRRLQSHCEA